MIIRRDFMVGMGALGAVVASGNAKAQGKRVFRAANPNAVLDAQQAFATCGRHPRLNYYEMEGVDIEYVNMNSIVQAMLSVATGEADTASIAPALFLPAVAKQPALGIIAAYNWLPRNANVVVVKPESPVKSIAELVGKRIGIRNQGDGGIMQLKLMYRELGLPASDIDLSRSATQGSPGRHSARTRSMRSSRSIPPPGGSRPLGSRFVTFRFRPPIPSLDPDGSVFARRTSRRIENSSRGSVGRLRNRPCLRAPISPRRSTSIGALSGLEAEIEIGRREPQGDRDHPGATEG